MREERRIKRSAPPIDVTLDIRAGIEAIVSTKLERTCVTELCSVGVIEARHLVRWTVNVPPDVQVTKDLIAIWLAEISNDYETAYYSRNQEKFVYARIDDRVYLTRVMP